MAFIHFVCDRRRADAPRQSLDSSVLFCLFSILFLYFPLFLARVLRPSPPEAPRGDALPSKACSGCAFRCRAPIASLDCMDDFSATSQQMLDQGWYPKCNHSARFIQVWSVRAGRAIDSAICGRVDYELRLQSGWIMYELVECWNYYE